VLPRIWQRNEDEGRRRLEELRSLTRAALAEMRTLLYELRPNTLIQTSLPDLLRQLVDAAAGRAQMHVTFSSEGKCVLPPDVQVGIYRIAQEALNNVARHACANAVTIHLNGQPGRVELWIADDGCGFDPATVSGNHFGLGIMRERAEAIGATLKITSRCNGGTQVLLLWQARRPLRLPGQPLPIDRG
jgi:signal transduction histidine kinase